MSFGIPVRNGLSISLLSTTSLSSGRGLRPSLALNFLSGTLDSRIDFTRTSSATYVDAAGKIVSTPASRNLLTFTQEFDNAVWTKNNVTITANSTAAPDGTMTADTLDEGTATANHAMFSGAATLVSGLNYAASIYLKAGSARWVQIPLLSATFGSNAWANFDLVGGAVGNTGSAVVSATITSAGNGWYRCVVVAPPTASGSGASLQVGFTDNANSATRLPSYTGSSKTVFAWGAQLEQASTATDYTRNNGGVYPPRFDYDPVTLAPKGLLIEEQRTNLLTYSQGFTNAAWNKSNITVTANSTTSPDGTLNADTIAATATGSSVFTSGAVAVTGTAATFTVYVKQGTGATTGNYFAIRNTTTSTTLVLATVNFSTGAVTSYIVGSSGVSLQNVGNGWWRVTCTATSGITSGNSLTGYVGFAGQAVTAGDFIYAYGAQLEAGAFATSYIPTVASQATRTADSATISGPNFSQWYNQSEGAIVAEWDSLSSSAGVANISDGTTSNRITVQNDNSFQGAVIAGGAAQTSLDDGTLAATNKVAFAYKADNFALSLNGSAAVTDTSGSLPSVDRLILGANGAGTASFLNGHIRTLSYYNTRLSNTQLQALTA